MSIPLDSDMGRLILKLAEERGALAPAPAAVDEAPTPSEARGDGMNKTERAYAGHLQWRKDEGAIRDWAFEPERLRIGDVKVGVKASVRAVWYKPDFRVEPLEGPIEMHEVKGFFREAAMVRIRAAASLHRCYAFVVVRRIKGSWEYERF